MDDAQAEKVPNRAKTNLEWLFKYLKSLVQTLLQTVSQNAAALLIVISLRWHHSTARSHLNTLV